MRDPDIVGLCPTGDLLSLMRVIRMFDDLLYLH